VHTHNIKPDVRRQPKAAKAARAARANGRGRGRRSAAEAERTRERLLRCAEKMFAQRGYGGTSLRELAAAAGVQANTVQHHFGSKQRLYAEVLARWDEQVERLVRGVIEQPGEPHQLVERVMDALFDFFLAHRQMLALNARATLGDGPRQRRAAAERGWVRFMRSSLAALRFDAPVEDLPLLLITIEGILHHHLLAAGQYRRLFGRDLGDPAVARKAKAHLAEVILALIEPRRGGATRPANPTRR